MKLQVISTPLAALLKPGQRLEIIVNTQRHLLYPLEIFSTSVTCFVPFALPSKKLRVEGLEGIPFEPPIPDFISIITQEFFYQGLCWTYSYASLLKRPVILEWPPSCTLKIEPSKFLTPSLPFLPQDIAALACLEEKGICSRLVGEGPGMISSLRELKGRSPHESFQLIHQKNLYL